MTILRTDIEKALDDLISNEEGMRFQGLAVVLAKQKWPRLVACERKLDLGLDAHANGILEGGGRGIGLACSITGTLEKIRADATKVKKNYPDVGILIFATPEKVTNQTQKPWAEKIRKEFGYDLIVMPREEIISSLLLPKNAQICGSHLRMPIAIESDLEEVVNRARTASAEVTASWLAHPRLSGKPLVFLRAARLDEQGRGTEDILDVEGIKAALAESRRVVLEGPAGTGKTTTLVQLAKAATDAGQLPFLINLPEWARSPISILDFIAQMREFRTHGINGTDLAKVYGLAHFAFLLNGWNEVSEKFSESAATALAELERDFPGAGIIVATRSHYVSPPLPGSFRARLLPLNRAQRDEYLSRSLADRAHELGSQIDQSPTLDQLTRTPLILSEVTNIFQSGAPIPTTRVGVLAAVMQLMEQSHEHRNELQRPPLLGHAQDYLSALAIQMTAAGATDIPENVARSIGNAESGRLKNAGQIAVSPEPAAVLNALTAHHVLERLEYPSITFRFEHQQFQEYFAALLLKGELWRLIEEDDKDGSRQFTEKYVNQSTWDEPLRMIAEAIGVEAPEDKRAVKAGKLLIEMALNVDPIFAAELVHVSAALVSKEIRGALSERLRSWYALPNEHHRQCALAGMLASGLDEFRDVILPLLSSGDQQVRLATYRTRSDIHVASLGPDWRKTVSGWKEEARTDFVSELLHNRSMPEIVDFAFADPSQEVKAAAISALAWVGSDEEVTRLLGTLDDDTFESVVQKLPAETIPVSAQPRALAAYHDLCRKFADAVTRLRMLLRAADLGDTGIADQVKSELNKVDLGKLREIVHFVIKPALDLVRRTDPEWVSHWAADRIASGALWPEHWIALVTSVPEELKERLLKRVESEDFKQGLYSGIISVLAASTDSVLADRVFSRLCALRQTIAGDPDQRHEFERAIERQLEALFRALPLNVAVTGVSTRLSKDVEVIELTVLTRLLSMVGNTVDRDNSEIRFTLNDDLRQGLRAYLKKGVPVVLREEDFWGEQKANLASALAQVGESEDMADLRELIRADVERVRKGRAARARGDSGSLGHGGAMSYANFHVQAVAQLDPGTADTVLLDVLKEPEYERDAAWALVRLVIQPKIEKEPGWKKDYRDVWAARAGRVPNSADIEGRRKRYAIAIRDRMATLLRERTTATQTAPYDYRLKELAKALASIDSRGSAGLVMEVLSLPGKWDGWRRIEALETLLFNGVILPADETLKIVDPIVEQVRTHGVYDNQQVWLLDRVLCVLPFVDTPSTGINKVRQVLSDLRFPDYELRDVATAVGHSRCKEALEFLRDLALDSNRAKQLGDAWINAIATLDTPQSRQLLLSFVDPEIPGLPAEVTFGRDDVLASKIAELAQRDNAIEKCMLRLCDMELPPAKRSLLTSVIGQIGTEEAVLAGLKLIDDTAKPPVPYELWKLIEAAFVERRPYGKAENVFTLASRSSNSIRTTLVEMATKDERRKKSAFALLGQIEVWRLEHGRPYGEPRNPAFESGVAWPPVWPER